MNRSGVLQNSPVQQMMAAGNTNWWAIAATRPPSHHQPHHPNSPLTPPLPTHHHHHHHSNNNFNFVSPHSSPSPFSSPSNWPLNCSINDINQDDNIAPDSWSHQLLMNGLVGEEERSTGLVINQAAIEQLVKQENYNPSPSHAFVYQNNEDFQEAAISNTNKNNNNNSLLSPHPSSKFMASSASTNSTTTTTTTTSSPQSCVTNNLFEISFTTAKFDHQLKSECNSSTVNGGAAKKAKIQISAAQSTFKVRKFGDRITTLHQLVSPCGKTDTASVLLEAIGYIRFLHSQIEALSQSYLRGGSGNNKRQQHPHSVQGERNCIFPEDPGQVELKDLKRRGLCLVPVSCTLNVGRDNGADYWAPALGGFRPVDRLD